MSVLAAHSPIPQTSSCACCCCGALLPSNGSIEHVSECIANRRNNCKSTRRHLLRKYLTSMIRETLWPRFQEHPLFRFFVEPRSPQECELASCILSDRLYLGSVDAAQSVTFLETHKICAVLNVALEIDSSDTMNVFSNHSISYDEIPLEDGNGELAQTRMREAFDRAFSFIDSHSRPVLVHCAMGVSRSATIVIAYLMNRLHMTLTDALILVRAKRGCVYPSKGFLAVLMRYEKELFGQVSFEPGMIDLHQDTSFIRM
mmetsp:Transcript_5271/g.9097  ORF Transcript_5271/g.9097 Transcript_5271/m.9097 type:complete len:259 (+) Transcript_5271:101-877(+)